MQTILIKALTAAVILARLLFIVLGETVRIVGSIACLTFGHPGIAASPTETEIKPKIVATNVPLGTGTFHLSPAPLWRNTSMV